MTLSNRWDGLVKLFFPSLYLMAPALRPLSSNLMQLDVNSFNQMQGMTHIVQSLIN